MVVFRIYIVLLTGCGIFCDAKENPGHPPYCWPDGPRFALNEKHQPLKGWKIQAIAPGQAEVFLNMRGREAHARGVRSQQNAAFKGKDETIYLLHFDYSDYLNQGGPLIPEKHLHPSRPVFLGWDYHDFSKRFYRKTGERGLSRNYIDPSAFQCSHGAVPLNVPRFQVENWYRQSDWQRFLMPTVTAEGGGDYLVINSFDRAGMTVGFMQMAAHTPNDMIPMLKHLIQNEELQKCRYANPARWFPELGITPDGKLGYREGNRVHSLEEATDRRNGNEGFSKWAWFQEDFVRFCNPCVKTVNQCELEFAARWLMWSMSSKMRRAQMEPVRESTVRTLQKLENAPAKVSGIEAAIAAVILHWKDGAQSQKTVSRLLREKSMTQSFFKLESTRAYSSWFNESSSSRKILSQRVKAVKKLFAEDPALRKRLEELTFDFKTGQLVAE